MNLEAIQRGEPGLGACLARGALGTLSHVFAGAHAARMGMYRCGIRRRVTLPHPVISVGNITAGGTGKTPVVAWLAEALTSVGYTPGVLARGYGDVVVSAEDGGPLNDEGAELHARFGGTLAQAQNPDRVAGCAQLLVASPDVNVLILDDGFQHVRVARQLDIVLIDALRPFGFGHRLPRGLLREGPGALARADLVIMTRADAVDAGARASLALEIGQHTDAPQAQATVRPRVLRLGADAQPPHTLAGTRAFAIAGTGNPQAFQRTLEDLGVRVLRLVEPGDHRRVSDETLAALCAEAQGVGARVVMTAKDAAKFTGLPADVGVLEIEVAFLEGEDLVRRAVLETAATRSA